MASQTPSQHWPPPLSFLRDDGCGGGAASCFRHSWEVQRKSIQSVKIMTDTRCPESDPAHSCWSRNTRARSNQAFHSTNFNLQPVRTGLALWRQLLQNISRVPSKQGSKNLQTHPWSVLFPHPTRATRVSFLFQSSSVSMNVLFCFDSCCCDKTLWQKIIWGKGKFISNYRSQSTIERESGNLKQNHGGMLPNLSHKLMFS